MKNLAERLTPGPKLAFLLASVVVALYFNNLVLLASMNAAMICICLLISDSFQEILKIVKRVAIGFPVLIIIFVISEPGLARDPGAAAINGLKGATAFILKIHFVLWVNLFTVFTSEPQDIVRTLRKIRVPRELCIMIMIILRFFPVMFEEAIAIYQAQQARGYSAGRLLNPANWLPLAIPLVVIVMKRSQDLAITLELKGLLD